MYRLVSSSFKKGVEHHAAYLAAPCFKVKVLEKSCACLNGASYVHFLDQIELSAGKKYLHFVSMPYFSGHSVSGMGSLAHTSIE